MYKHCQDRRECKFLKRERERDQLKNVCLFCHACHASSVTTQFSIVARYHGIDFPCDLGIVIVLSCSLVKTLSRFTAKIYFE